MARLHVGVERRNNFRTKTEIWNHFAFHFAFRFDTICVRFVLILDTHNAHSLTTITA